jgi:ergothioneine biosynthesis protein EgtB
MPSTTKELLARYVRVRRATEAICAPLEIDDHLVQPVDFVSPPKWHLGHTTWFFETFVLKKHLPGYLEIDPHYRWVFNSYYEALGERVQRPKRASMARPTLAQVREYRAIVDALVPQPVQSLTDAQWCEFAPLFELGMQHEEQHQELLYMDIKYILRCSPSRPAYSCAGPIPTSPTSSGFLDIPGGIQQIGFDGDAFCFDNERPRHDVLLRNARIARAPVTNGEYLAFIDDGGYNRPDLWLSDGWARVQTEQWAAPLYWEMIDGVWHEFTLRGLSPVERSTPVCHVSYFEADAFARWSGKRLPTESEYEVAAQRHGVGTGGMLGVGAVWEWTSSAYLAYPGFVPFAGALAEYNGKFMVNQMVLRGGCCATPDGHARITYRNFFQPEMRWQFAGIRLADDTH